MKYLKNVLGLTLVGALLLTSLVGCSTADVEEDTTGDTTESTPIDSDDVIMAYSGMAHDTVVMTVNGVDITLEGYLFWAVDTINSYYSYYGDSFWEETVDGMTATDVVMYEADYGSTLYAIVEYYAAELGIALTDENWAELAAQEEELITYFEEEGGLSYDDILASNCVTREGFERINTIYYLYAALYEMATAEGGFAEYSEEAKEAYEAYTGIYSTKHILFSTYTTDEDGNSVAMTDEEKAEVLAEAEGYVEILRNSSDLEAEFDIIMNERSDDSRDTDGNLYYPDGYVAYPGDMVTAYEEAAMTLEPGEISDPAESTYGYHIVLRLEYTDTTETEVIDWLMSTQIETWMEEAEIVYTDAYDSINLYTVYNNMLVDIAARTEALVAAALEEEEATADAEAVEGEEETDVAEDAEDADVAEDAEAVEGEEEADVAEDTEAATE